MKIWAHRGCSQCYPENTLLSFEKAASLKNLTGIELDIQLTSDGHIVVIHDERVDRTTEGIGYVKDYTLTELKRLHIYADANPTQQIPTIEEVFDALEKHLKDGLKINIELKNSEIPYAGMENKIIEMVHNRGLQSNIVFSSANALSIEKIKLLDKDADTAILDNNVSDCLYKLKGGCGANALHPYWRCMDLPKERLEGYIVRAWMSGHLYPQKPTGNKLDMGKLENKGITDIILNEPERYVDL
jgi:glycerophosphoryl diester phosphodiesterase